MFNFKNLIGSRTTAADIATALNEARVAQAGYIDELRELEAQRPGLLLQAPDKVVRENEAAINDARLNVERTVVAIKELERRHTDALQAEEVAAKDLMLSDARNAAARGVEILHRYADMAASMAADLAELRRINHQVNVANQTRDGHGEKVIPPHAVVAPHSLRRLDIAEGVRLPRTDGGQPYWGN